MKKLPISIMALLLVVVAGLSVAQETKLKKVLIFPFKVIEKGAPETLSREIAGVLGAELAREGDVEAVSGHTFAAVVQEKRIDPARVARVAARADSQMAIWGIITKGEDGYSAEVSVLPKESTKPRQYNATGKDLDELLGRMKDLASQIGTASMDRPKVGQIKVEGNKRIQRDTILNKISMRPSGPFRRSAISDEIRELYSMGFFEDIQIKAEDTSKGDVDVTIIVKERPSIKAIEIEGNKVYSSDDIIDALTNKSLAVFSVARVRDDIAKIKKMYEKEGYYQPKIEYEMKELSPNEAKLIFKIDEGQKSYLNKIGLEGSNKLADKDIKKIMSIKEKDWFWFLNESGTFTRDKLDENRIRLMAFYLDNGFINVQVGAPQLDIQDGSASVTYPIREGERYQVRKVEIQGDLVAPADKIAEGFKIQPHKWYNRSLLGDDIKAITKMYNNLGYAYADVEPKQLINDKHNFLDVTYNVNKGERVSIERVDISGNERTRDKVIRRNLYLSEGDLYNADRIEATKKNLEGMEFFESVQVKTSPGSRPDLMNVNVEVTEKKTGSLAAGLGYSTQEGAQGNINLKEKNVLGLGIVANAKSTISGRRNSYEGSVTYPWMFDLPLSGTVRAYKSQGKEASFLRDSDGFSFHLAYPLYGYWNMTSGIARDSNKLSGMERVFARSIVNYYSQYNTRAERFMNISENSISLSLNRDTRNSGMIPTLGSKISIGSRISGFGGDVAFSNYFSEASYYHPLFWQVIFKLKANASILSEIGNDPIPFDRRIMLGGIQSIRGYNYGDIGPRDKFGSIIGGDRALFSTVECLFPLVEQLKLNGVVFADAGNAWNARDGILPNDVKAGFGVGVRWASPMGPMRLEYGWKVNPSPGEEKGSVAFGMGQLF